MLIQINNEQGSIASRLRAWRRTRASAMAIATAIAAMVLVAGCGGPSSPSPPVPPPAVSNSAAVLEITSFVLSLHTHEDGSRWYEPRLVLTEKSGKSAALLQKFQFGLPGGGGDTLSADGCLLSRTVPAGGTWSDSQAQAFGGCLPAFRESFAGTPVSLTITFSDQQGVAGQVTGSATAAVPSAVLAFSTFELSLQSHRDGSRWYEATVELTETSGTSAALLQELVFRLPNGDGEIIGVVCLAGSSGRVPAGGTWKLSQVHPGCLPTWRESIGTQVTLTVRFTDERGAAGQVTASVTAPPPGD